MAGNGYQRLTDRHVRGSAYGSARGIFRERQLRARVIGMDPARRRSAACERASGGESHWRGCLIIPNPARRLHPGLALSPSARSLNCKPPSTRGSSATASYKFRRHTTSKKFGPPDPPVYRLVVSLQILPLVETRRTFGASFGAGGVRLPRPSRRGSVRQSPPCTGPHELAAEAA